MNTAALPRFAVPSWFVAIAPVIPALVLLAATASLTVGQTPDSVKYLLAAESLAQTGTFGDAFLLWPPLYPALLALLPASILGNLGAFATVLGVWAIGRRVIAPIPITVALLALACLPQFGRLFGMVWSESVYVPLTVWLAYFWIDYLDTRSRRSLVAACVLLALALLARHVGVVLAIAVAMMAVQHRRSLFPIALACIPYALWVGRTFMVSGTYAGHRPPLENPDLLSRVESFGRVIGHWFAPHFYPATGGVVIGLAFLLVAFAALLYHARQSPLMTFAALFVLGHCILTVYTASRLFLDVDPRTLSPIFWPILLLVFWGFDKAHRPSRWYYYPVAAYALFWFTAPNAITNALV